jgi:hypothetical protein|tara:strand:- start:4912 stop:5502 length:591 start_codon:yes stop_codon:yes gene_type:complete
MSLLVTELQNELKKNLLQASRPALKADVNRSFQQIKKEMIQEFLKHPVTIEINRGVESTNSSGTLGGITNLFSFIGFDKGSDPIQPILDRLLSTSINLSTSSGLKARYTVTLPTAQEIFAITPLPYFEGRSWAQGIERGISGLGYFLKKSKGSRSGFGIQSNKVVRPGVKFKNTQYISALINKYSKKFKKLERQVI